ncbi:MAG: hypothetical protein IPG60_02795 [Bacteroidetes bacterium]|nr:hypothetical protein [Bacteroidota bacterium]MBP7399884.1 hypothetical protein [Chitinophagales bacterium]MBK8486155.1 hypothetical protein [Bacteroidota bacterium]MBK8681101.1 hypothetical protein [Bacteroidota bacterium]MBP9189508.1 hypothetical protein [Chitinophagales bacterium]
MDSKQTAQLYKSLTEALDKIKAAFPENFKEKLQPFMEAIESENDKTGKGIILTTVELVEKSKNKGTVIGLMAACKLLLVEEEE